MRFLLLNQFYPPDSAPTGQYLHDLAQVLVERGHQVQVICSRRSYDGTTTYPRRETRSGVEVFRLSATGFGRRSALGKLADYATFYISLLATLLRPRHHADLILSLTTPPFLGLLGKVAAKRHGCRHANWIMDVYPDVMFAYGMTRRDGLVFRGLQGLARLELRGAAPVVALGTNMAARVSNYGTEAAQEFSFVTALPLWSDPALSPWPEPESIPLRAERNWSPAETVLLYSGNMGLGHRFGEFLEAARQLGESGPRWIFCGSGRRRAEIEAFATSNPGARIELLPYAPKARLREHLCAADVHLMSLNSEWQGLMVPSKLQASFAVGRPVIYVGGADNEAAGWIRDSGGGWIVAEHDIAGLLAAITQASDPVVRRARGQAAWRFAQQHFKRTTNCAQLARLLETGQPEMALGDLAPAVPLKSQS